MTSDASSVVAAAFQGHLQMVSIGHVFFLGKYPDYTVPWKHALQLEYLCANTFLIKHRIYHSYQYLADAPQATIFMYSICLL